LMTGDFPESRVMQIWQDCPGRTDLETEEDGPVKIIYPGRINDDRGADFRDAVIETSRGMLTGDIEIHVKSSHWWAHRHHRDPLYNRVILHVVYRNDMAQSGRLENGRRVPTLVLERLVTPGNDHFLSPLSPRPCRGSAGTQENFLGIIDMAGEQRFQSRAAGFQTVSSRIEAGQALYRGIMAALGYARNKHPMIDLAGRMPLRRLETMVTAPATAAECLARYQAMLTGMAGLLPSQRARRRGDDVIDPWVERLERIWTAAGERVTMSETDWRFFRVRPGNFPARRIAAMGRLLLRYREEGLLTGLMARLDEAAVNGSHRALEGALIIEAGEYREGYPEGGGSFHKSSPALLGRERAADIVINVLLPFAVAWGRVNSRPQLAEKAADLYRRYPALATNTLGRHMSLQFGIDGNLVNTARRQQGLLHIFKSFCSEGGCHRCPVNKAA
jgi:hypothetical protein